MTFTYSNTNITTDLARVRLLIGDVNADAPLKTDEEINAILALNPNIYTASSVLCRSIASNFAQQVHTKVEGVSANFSDKFKHYTQLAQRYEKQAKESGGGLGSPFVGGISISDMNSVDQDADRFPSQFEIGMDNNPPTVERIDEFS